MKLTFFRRLLAFLFVLSATPLWAGEADLRIIVIDNNLYGGITSATDRDSAIDDFLSDVASIIAERDVARHGPIETLFVYDDRGQIDIASDINQRDLIASLRSSRMVADMRRGRAAAAYGIPVEPLRSRLHDILRSQRMQRLALSETRQIDLHIFASRWIRSSRSNEGNMLAQEHPALCYQQESKSFAPWPQNITLAVEIRTPADYPIPTPHALQGLMTILSGSAAVTGPVRMRGTTTKGPNCEMSPTLNDFPQASTVGNTGLVCGKPQVFSETILDTQLRCEVTDHPAVGTTLVDAPVHLVSRAQTVSLGTFTFETAGRNMVASISTGVAGPVLYPTPGTTQSTPPAGGLLAPAELDLAPQAGCRADGLTEADVQGQSGTIQVVASRAPCSQITLRLGEVTLP